jgi:hypothetical protein
MTDREQILISWVIEESKRVGRELIEGFDYEVRNEGDALILVYYTDPDFSNVQIFEITDNPLLH